MDKNQITNQSKTIQYTKTIYRQTKNKIKSAIKKSKFIDTSTNKSFIEKTNKIYRQSKMASIPIFLSYSLKNSKTNTLIKNQQKITRDSFIYRWLAQEPEPETIEIDLKQTLSVGLIIKILDKTITYLLPAYITSKIYKITRQTTDKFKNYPIRLVSIILLSMIASIYTIQILSGELTQTQYILYTITMFLFIIGTQIKTPLKQIKKSTSIEKTIELLEPPEIEKIDNEK